MKNLSQIPGKPRPKGGGKAVTPARKSGERRGNRALVANRAAGSCAHGVQWHKVGRAVMSAKSGKEASQ